MGRRSIKDARQKEMVIAFYKIAKKEGLENASIAKTAKLMGINPSLILHYFDTKDQLVISLADHILHKYLQIFITGVGNNMNTEQKLICIIDNIFSKKWNRLFDDGVSYSCYSLALRDRILKKKFREVLDALREQLTIIIAAYFADKQILDKDPALTADYIFLLVDGTYYYLSLIDSKSESELKLAAYKKRALALLGID